jgi:rRNA biogenesis protein RRP5
MAPFKRSAEDTTSGPVKKARTAVVAKPTINPVFSSALVADETDFPRGGGTSLTPLELKETREAGKKEAELEVAAVSVGEKEGKRL